MAERLSGKLTNGSVGLIHVRLYRPFSAKLFLQALPSSTVKICVVDQTKGALFGDVAAALHSEAQAKSPLLVHAKVCPSKSFTPVMASQVWNQVHFKSAQASFEVTDDREGKWTKTSDLLSQATLWTFGHQPNSPALRASAEVLGPRLHLFVQQLNSYDKLNPSVHRSELRFSSIPIQAEYPIGDADVVVCDNPSVLLLPQYKVIQRLKKGGHLVLNTAWSLSEIEDTFTGEVKRHVAEMDATLHVIDASAIATRYGGTQADSVWLLQAVILMLCESSSMSYRQAVHHLDSIIRESFDSVQVAQNFCGLILESTLQKHISTVSYPKDAWLRHTGKSEQVSSVDMVPHHMFEKAADGEPLMIMHNAYLSLLEQVLGNRLALADTNASRGAASVETANLESCYGEYLSKLQGRRRLVEFIKSTLANSGVTKTFPRGLVADLGTWLNGHNSQSVCNDVVPRIISMLEEHHSESEALEHLFKEKRLLEKTSRWIVGGEHWAYDLSSSGIHHVIASGEDINVLVFDNQRIEDEVNGLRKKDIGLYAMNYGGAYVASVSVLSSHAQALRAVAEADAYPGPSIILAHAPSLPEDAVAAVDSSQSENKATEQLTKEANLAVDSGRWPLYRWNPLNKEQAFVLDSNKLRAEVEEFLKRDQQLSLMASKEMKLVPEISSSAGTKLVETHKHLQTLADQRRLTAQFEQLSQSLGNPQLDLLVLYGSDGGNAASVAETLSRKAEMSGCGEVRCMEANEFSVDELSEEKHVVYVLSTAGQGEHCANAKNHASALMETKSKLPGLKTAVFGLGDSHYWGEGSPDSAKYFCKPAKDIEDKLKELGAEVLIPVGLGDDQNDDGYDGALSEWEPALWEALEVKVVEGEISGGAPKIIDDDIKSGSNFLRGMIDEGLRDHTTGKLLPEDTKLTKFHGIYQQDLRSVREELDEKGLERAYSFMIRIGVPAGVATCEQYIAMDELCSKYANGALKLTTRQAFQLHGVVKKELKLTMQGINRACMDTLAACGDVNRNVIGNPHHRKSDVHAKLNELANKLSTHLKPRTSAYHEIWLDKKKVAGSIDDEPIYGKTYLPRKFKIALAVPPLNDVDVFAHCLGFIAIVKNGRLEGWNVTIGGGMGTTHGNKATYPRLSEVLGFITSDQVVKVAESIVILQRDHGERTNRKHARLKYTVEDYGLEFFKREVEKLCGFKIQEKRAFKFETNADPYGWHQGKDGLWDYTMFIENGYIKDKPGYPIKTALRKIAEFHVGGEMNLTANQNLIIGGVSSTRKPQIEAMLKQYSIDNSRYSAMRLHSMACVALPTCALAMAESQTYLPSLIAKLEETLDECGLRHDAITIRMTGCPNGCARPYIAEIAFVGKAPGNYNLYLGGGHAGNRINKMYKEGVNEEQILEILRPMLKQYSQERRNGERFGDWVIRAGVIEPTVEGKYFWSYGEENKLDTPSGTLQIYW